MGMQDQPKPGKGNVGAPAASKWWNQESTGVGERPIIVSIIETLIKTNNNQRHLSLLQWYRLYQNTQARGLLAGNYFRPQYPGRSNRLTLNIVKSAVDTMVARITEKEPKVTYLTRGGTWSEQKKAKNLDKLTSGIFKQTKFVTTAEDTTRDAYIYGTAPVKVYANDDDRVAIDRVFAEELIVDDVEAVYGKPRSMYQIRMYSRDVLRGMFADNPAALKMIDTAPVAKVDSMMKEFALQADLVFVVEAWHLPSRTPKKFTREEESERTRCMEQAAEYRATGEDAKARACEKDLQKIESDGHDGRHAIVLENGILHFEAWRKTWFPFALTHWTKPSRGFLNGSGIPEELIAIQYEINKILVMMSEAIAFCVPKVLVEESSNVVQGHIDDLVMGIIKYRNIKPELMTWNAVPQHLVEQLERLIRQAYEIIGISQFSAQSTKPADLESGAAMREFIDIESGRFFRQGKAYEQLYLDVAELTIRTVREIALRNKGSYPVRTSSRRGRMLIDIDWKDIDLEDEDFVMEVFPTSALPRTPAGRLAMVNDLMNLGFLDKEDALRLLSFPDLDAVNEIMEAAAEFTNWQLENMIEKGLPQVPQPYMNLAYALRHAQSAYLRASTMGVDDNRLNLVRVYVENVKALMAAAMQAALPPGSQPGVPGGPPTMPAPGEPQMAPTPGGVPGGPGVPALASAPGGQA